MSYPFNPTRLALARRRRGLSKVAFAEAVDLSTRIVTAYERGEKVPLRRNLANIGDVLRFPEEFFFGPDLDEPPMAGSSFRALSSLTATERDQGLAAGALALLLSDYIEAKFSLPSPDVPQYYGIDAETAAMGVRAEWGLGERPISNMIHLLEAHGVRVFSLAEECHEMDAFSFWRANTPYILLNTMKSGEHGRMDAAHELGHLVLHRKGVGLHGRSSEREVADFASTFLMPSGSVLAEAPWRGTLGQIIEAKQKWKVSVASLTFRMHKLEMLTEWQYRSLFIDIARNGYRTSEPRGIPQESSQVLVKVFDALAQDGVMIENVAEDLTIDVGEVRKLIFGLIPGRGSLRLVS